MDSTPWSPKDHPSLPQHGFGPEFTFDNLVQHNPFVFRVHTPKPRSPFADSTEGYFIGPRFDERYTVSPSPLSERCDLTEDVAVHMDWTRRSSSPYISTSFSFAWAMWEAVRRYRMYVKHDIEIAVIDARAVGHRSVTALELLRKTAVKRRHKDYWKWYRFATESQNVLVYGSIPGSAVLTSIPLLALLEKVPSYFMHPEPPHDPKSSVLDRLGWHAVPKPSFRQFCQDMSERFLLMPCECRLRDTTVQSVRLALAFLRPWFYAAVLDDFGRATSALRDLSFVIAQWPGQWWTREQESTWDLVEAVVVVLGEEVRAKEKEKVEMEMEMEMSRGMEELKEVVEELESRIQSHQCPVQVPPEAEITNETTVASVLETVSSVGTSVFIGTLISICILSLHRRPATATLYAT